MADASTLDARDGARPLRAGALVERGGYALFWTSNAIALFALAATGALTEQAALALHVVNIAVLLVFESVSPVNARWRFVDDGGLGWGAVRWRLLLKTVGWYAFNARIWFRLHGWAIGAFALWLAGIGHTDVSGLPFVVQLVGFALLVDGVRYAIHRAAHALPWLWRFHAMHHTPTHMTSMRAWWTHPVDDVLLYSAEIVLLVVLGVDPVVGLVWVSLDESFQLMNHANVNVRPGLLGAVFQHPRLHLVHHARVDDGAQTMNFAETFTLWDRVFGTFEERTDGGMRDLEIGIAPVRRRTLWHQLSAPFWRSRADL